MGKLMIMLQDSEQNCSVLMDQIQKYEQLVNVMGSKIQNLEEKTKSAHNQ